MTLFSGLRALSDRLRLIQGSHWFVRSRPDDGSVACGHWSDQPPEHRCVVKAGSVLIIHFEMWHRASKNQLDETRFMYKFPVVRMREPQPGPTGSRDGPRDMDGWAANADAKSRFVWNWMRGLSPLPTSLGGAAMSELVALMQVEEEPGRTDAAYRAAEFGAPAVDALVRELHREANEALAALPPADEPDHSNPSQLIARTALVAMGAAAVPALLKLLASDHWNVRAAAADALGDIGPTAAGTRTAAVVAALLASLDEDGGESLWVVRNVVEALGRFGAHARSALPALASLLPVGAPSAGPGEGPSYVGTRHNAALAIAKIAALVPVGSVPEACVTELRACVGDPHHVCSGNARIALQALELVASEEARAECGVAGAGAAGTTAALL